MTDTSFHEKWYYFELSQKRTLLLMMIATNLECKLSTLEKLNLSLTSFMTVHIKFNILFLYTIILYTILIYY